jgi:hypothetical protein
MTDKPFTIEELTGKIQEALDHIACGKPTHSENDIHRLSRELYKRGRE